MCHFWYIWVGLKYIDSISNMDSRKITCIATSSANPKYVKQRKSSVEQNPTKKKEFKLGAIAKASDISHSNAWGSKKYSTQL